MARGAPGTETFMDYIRQTNPGFVDVLRQIGTQIGSGPPPRHGTMDRSPSPRHGMMYRGDGGDHRMDQAESQRGGVYPMARQAQGMERNPSPQHGMMYRGDPSGQGAAPSVADALVQLAELLARQGGR